MTTKRIFSVTLFFLALEVIFLFIKHLPNNPPVVLDYWVCGLVAVGFFYGLTGLVLSFIRNTTTQTDAIYKGILLAIFGLNVILMYAIFYRRFGLIDGDTNVPVRRSRDFLYFAIVTWTTLGFGDIRPSSGSRLFAASEALFGYIFMGAYLGLVLKVASSIETVKAPDDNETSSAIPATTPTAGPSPPAP